MIIKATVDGVVREVELNDDQIYYAHLELQKHYDVADVDGYLTDWFSDDYDDREDCDEIKGKIDEVKDSIAKSYRHRLDNDDTWFNTLRSVVADFIKSIDWQKNNMADGVMEFDTYPPVFNKDGSENEDYDETFMEFTVPSEWAIKWIANWSWQSCVPCDQFKNWYDWDDTLRMYDDAAADGAIISERILER